MKIFPHGRWAEKPVWFWIYTLMLTVIVASVCMENMP